nr:MAG TPA: tail fiber protein [Caudoviricetes sp.]
MSELVTMYPAQANSPETSLSGALTAAGTTVNVVDGSVLPEAPNLLTIGADGSTAETVLMTAKSGNVLTVTRAQNGTTARAWSAGDVIARYFTAADQTAMQENIKKLNEGKAEKAASPTAGNFAGLDASGNPTDSGKKPGDFAAACHTHTGKADKVSSATAGHFAGLDSSGNLTDSGKKPGDFAAASHTHTDKADKVKSATAGHFAGLDSSGNLTDSGKKPGDFANASHAHAGYAEVKIFSGVSVAASAWVSDSTYAAYPYAASIACPGVTASHVPEVVFGATEAASGNFAPVALSGSGTVKIYAATKPTAAITVQSITCIKAVS